MSNNNGYLVVLLIALCLIVGGFAGHYLAPKQVEVTKEVENPLNVELESQVSDLEAEVANLNSELSAKDNTIVSAGNDVLADAKEELLLEIANDRSLRVVDGDRFSVDEITLGVSKESSISVDSTNRRDTVTTVSFKIELKYNSLDDDNKAVYVDKDVVVKFHSNSNKETEVLVEDSE